MEALEFLKISEFQKLVINLTAWDTADSNIKVDISSVTKQNLSIFNQNLRKNECGRALLIESAEKIPF